MRMEEKILGIRWLNVISASRRLTTIKLMAFGALSPMVRRSKWIPDGREDLGESWAGRAGNLQTHNLCVPVAYVAGARPSAGRRSPGGYRSARAYVRQPAEPAGRASRKVERVADERDGRHGVQVGRADEHESREARMRRVPASRQARCGRLTTMISAPCRQAVEVDPRRSRLSCRGDGKHFRRLRGTDCPLRVDNKLN